MNRCLSEPALLECYTGEGAADDLVHVRSCLKCAGRYKALERDMNLITQALQAPPPGHHGNAVQGLSRWRVAVSAAAVAAAFIVGWSLRGVSTIPFGSQRARVALHQPAAAGPPIQVSALGPAAAAPAIYAAFVQGAFSGDPCSGGNDPLEPGCL